MEPALTEKLEEMRAAYAETLELLADPDVLADQTRYQELARRHAELKNIVAAYDQQQAAALEAAEAAELAGIEEDPATAEGFGAIAKQKEAEAAGLERELKLMLVPRDPNDERDVIVELRAAVGGEEAGLWAADLYRMYQRFAERSGWGFEPIDISWTDSGGITIGTFAVKGFGAYSRFKYEAGPHRVQRVPKTESQGRVHTSIATVAVLPEVEPVDVDLKDHELKIDVFRSSGPGGQSVNTTDSAVRITHLPTGIVVACQDEKSQLQNKTKALRVLRARLYQLRMDEQLGERASARKAQVGAGERAEKIRTYNYKENRVTDHRVGITLHSLGSILDGDLTEFHEALMADEQARRLAEE